MSESRIVGRLEFLTAITYQTSTNEEKKFFLNRPILSKPGTDWSVVGEYGIHNYSVLGAGVDYFSKLPSTTSNFLKRITPKRSSTPQEDRLVTFNGIRKWFLNIKTLEIREFTGVNPSQWIAVSHLWDSSGDKGRGSALVKLNSDFEGSSWELGLGMTTQIVRAIHLASSNQIEWLWYDAVCLPQDDISINLKILKSDMMTAMGLVFYFSTATLVELDEIVNDRSYQDELPVTQEIVKGIDKGIASYCFVLAESRWMKRVWTAQEVVLCNEPHVMTAKGQIISLDYIFALIQALDVDRSTTKPFSHEKIIPQTKIISSSIKSLLELNVIRRSRHQYLSSAVWLPFMFSRDVFHETDRFNAAVAFSKLAAMAPNQIYFAEMTDLFAMYCRLLASVGDWTWLHLISTIPSSETNSWLPVGTIDNPIKAALVSHFETSATNKLPDKSAYEYQAEIRFIGHLQITSKLSKLIEMESVQEFSPSSYNTNRSASALKIILTLLRLSKSVSRMAVWHPNTRKIMQSLQVSTKQPLEDEYDKLSNFAVQFPLQAETFALSYLLTRGDFQHDRLGFLGSRLNGLQNELARVFGPPPWRLLFLKDSGEIAEGVDDNEVLIICLFAQDVLPEIFKLTLIWTNVYHMFLITDTSEPAKKFGVA
ncbi:hypothetical protein HK096_005090, partial [Nowakowskiella sp. JEL0078]